MKLDDLFISLGIKADTKSIDAVIKKIDTLNTKIKNLDSINVKGPTGNKEHDFFASLTKSKNAARSEWIKDIKREESINKKREKFAIAAEKEEERDRKKKEKAALVAKKEEEKRDKEKEKAAQKFFKTIDNGFANVAKGFLGLLTGAGVLGYVAKASAQSISAANLSKIFNVDPQVAQKLGNVFSLTSHGAVSKEDVNSLAGNIALAYQNALTGLDQGALATALGATGLTLNAFKDFETAITSLRGVAQKYPTAQLASLFQLAGVGPTFIPGITASEEEYQKAYNQPVLTNKQIGAASDVTDQYLILKNNLTNLEGLLIETFGPNLTKFLEQTNKVLENIRKEDLQNLSQNSIDKIGASSDFLLESIGIKKKREFYNVKEDYSHYNYNKEDPEYLRYTGKLNNIDDVIKVRIPEAIDDYIKDIPSNPTPRADGTFGYVGRIAANPNDISSSLENNRYRNIISDSFGQTPPVVNNTVNTNIYADKLDQGSIPFIADKINGSVTESLSANDFLRSRYTTANTPR
jgi:hypothetical protein